MGCNKCMKSFEGEVGEKKTMEASMFYLGSWEMLALIAKLSKKLFDVKPKQVERD